MDKYRDMKLRKWSHQMPVIPFRSDWNVRIIPPFAGAAVRFTVSRGNSGVSVFADFDNSLGYRGDPPQPYWEVYPDSEQGDVARFDLDDVNGLCDEIEASLVAQEGE